MKAITRFSVLALLLAGWMPAVAQADDAEVPGDHFSLEGALELFKKSSSPEEFEKMLNSPDAKVNNLDLNGDGYVDYIRVLDRQEGNIHLFIMQAVVSDHESQDIAVIELEKLANGKAVLQIIGDEDIYGVTTIIEPTQEVRTYAGTRTTSNVVNVWAWPSVQYVYGPRYVVWVSPWTWHVRPVWWRSWRPVTYVHYYSVWNPYRPYYSVCHTRRIAHGHRIYAPYRTTSVIVHNRHHRQIKHYRDSYADSRNGRTRNDRTRFTDQGNSSGRSAARTRSDYNVSRNSSSSRDATTTTNRPVSRERSTTVNRNSYKVRETNASENASSATTPARTRTSTSNYDRQTPIDQNRNSTQRQPTRKMPESNATRTSTQRTTDFSRRSNEAPARVQRSDTRERQAPSTMNRSSAPARSNPNFSRSTNSAPAKVQQRQQQMSRPSTTPPSRQSQPQRTSGQNSSDVRRGR